MGIASKPQGRGRGGLRGPDLKVLRLSQIPTPLDAFLIVTDPEDLLWASDFAGSEGRIHRLLARRIGGDPAALTLEEAPPPATIAQAVTAYFAGEVTAIDALPVRMNGTRFQNHAWAALRRLPAGAPLSYGAQAAQLGRPGAARAVGHANQANPYSLIIPCHRLIGASGELTGYAGGLARKRWLLDHESRHAGAELGA